MSSPAHINGAEDMHENLYCIGDAEFPGLSNQHLTYASEIFSWDGAMP